MTFQPGAKRPFYSSAKGPTARQRGEMTPCLKEDFGSGGRMGIMDVIQTRAKIGPRKQFVMQGV